MVELPSIPERDYGHYGLPSWLMAAAAVACLLAFLALPYGVIDYRGPGALDDDAVWPWHVNDMRSDKPADDKISHNSPNVAIAGIVLMLVGGGLLAGIGSSPLTVHAARWIGTAGGAIGSIGAAMTWMSSMYAVGTGFATFLRALFGAEYFANFWAISPLFMAAGSGFFLWQARHVLAKVVAVKDGLRDQTSRRLRGGLLAMACMGALLFVPWSIGLVPDGLSDTFEGRFDRDDNGALWLSAEEITSITPAEAATFARYEPEQFTGMKLLFHAGLSLTWTAFATGLLTAILGTAASTGKPATIMDGAKFPTFVTVLLGAWTAVMYLLAWVWLFSPGDTDHTYLPGFLPALVLIPAWWFVKDQREAIQEALGTLAPQEGNAEPA